MSKYKIIMTGGGTAGHVTPNLALAPKLREKGFEIKYIGSYNGIEKEIITDAAIEYYPISSGKLRRYFDVKNFTDPFKVMKGICQALSILSKEKPDVVFSKGGFVSVAKMAKMDIVPIAICGFTGYAFLPFTKHLTLKVGKPISYQLPEDEIVKQWTDFMEKNFS